MTTTKKPDAQPKREDRPGHLDPKYAASLRELGHEAHAKDAKAFVDGAKSGDDLAEELAEEAVVAMTSGEDGLEDDLQAPVDEENGGPFVRSTAKEEFAKGTDASNPKSAKREPFPKT